MKHLKLVFAVILILSFFSTKGQCILNAGPDLYTCSAPYGYDTIHVGAGITLTNATPPLSYAWKTRERIKIGSYSYTLYASDFLDDTTSANPVLIYGNGNPVEFELTVTDSLGNSCIDSISVIYSNAGSHLAYLTVSINHGDSVFLNFTPSIVGGIPPVEYRWRPNHGLKDSTSTEGFWAKPDYSINYYPVLMDAAGCIYEGAILYYVTVNHIGFEENDLSTSVNVYPNPAQDIVRIDVQEDLKIESATLHDMFGNEVVKILLGVDFFDVSKLPSGIYFIRFVTEEGIINKKIEILNVR